MKRESDNNVQCTRKSKFVYPDLTTHHWFTMYWRGCILFSLMNSKIKGSGFGKFFDENENFRIHGNDISVSEKHFRMIKRVSHECKSMLVWYLITGNNVMGGMQLGKVYGMVRDMLEKETLVESYELACKIDPMIRSVESNFSYKEACGKWRNLAYGEWSIPGIKVKNLNNIGKGSWESYLRNIPRSSVVCNDDHWVQYLGKSGNKIIFCDPREFNRYEVKNFDDFASVCSAVIEKGGNMPADSENIQFDDSESLLSGELSDAELDELVKNLPTSCEDDYESFTYKVDEESEFFIDEQNAGPLRNMRYNDRIKWGRVDRNLYSYECYLYIHGAFNRIRKIYNYYHLSEGSFKYLEGMIYGYKKKYLGNVDDLSNNDIFDGKPETYSRCYPKHKILEYEEYLFRELRENETTYIYTLGDHLQALAYDKPFLYADIEELLKSHDYGALKELCVKEQLHPVFYVMAEREEEDWSMEIGDKKTSGINFSEIDVKLDFSRWRMKEIDRLKELEKMIREDSQSDD